jgi:formylglycine-generating enzyme required for sulfatase activity
MKKYLLTSIYFLSLLVTGCLRAAPVLSPKEVFVEGKEGIGDFYIFQYELTVAEYKKYLEVTGETFDFEKGMHDGLPVTYPVNERITSDDCPMPDISFLQLVSFANWLSKQHGLNRAYSIKSDGRVIWDKKANGYRAPFSSEWEWAAIGGKEAKGFKYPGSDNLDEVAWYGENSQVNPSRDYSIYEDIGYIPRILHPVGTKKPNELGIYDMLGSVYEWCWDLYKIESINKNSGIDGEIAEDFDWVNGSAYFVPFDDDGSTYPVLKEYDESYFDYSAFVADNNSRGIRRIVRGYCYYYSRNKVKDNAALNSWDKANGECLKPLYAYSDIGIRLVRNAAALSSFR